MIGSQRIRIRLCGYDHKVLDAAVQEIVQAVKRTGGKVAGPIPLPTSVDIHIGKPYAMPDLSPNCSNKEIAPFVKEVEDIIRDMIAKGLKQKRGFFSK